MNILVTPQRRAFLSTIAFSEGTSTSPATEDDGYDVIVTGADGRPEVFTDYSIHPFAHGRPPKVINSRGLRSTASGRYQLLLRWWTVYVSLLRLKGFSQDVQDAIALQQIKERGALAMIDAGHFEKAVATCSNLWASFPGAGYNQHENKMTSLRVQFLLCGGNYNG